MTLPLLALGWLLGIASVALWDAPGWAAGAVAFAGCAGVFALRRAWLPLALAMAAFALIGGLWFARWYHAEPPSLSRYVGETVTLEGRIVSEPDPGATWTAYDIAADALLSDGDATPIHGKVRVYVGQYDEYLPGTQVMLRGDLREAPVFPDFDYRSYLARHGVVATMSRPAFEVLADPPRWSFSRNAVALRLEMDRALQHSLPEPEASLAGGIAFGRDGNLPDALYQDFRDTGLAHIVAVSGSNVSLVAALTFLVFIRVIGRRLAIFPAAASVAAYVVVAGFSASVVRAGIMAGVFLAGQYLGRQQAGLAALGAAAIAMTAHQPGAALDIGFQLSLAATAGLIVLGPWLRYGIERLLNRSWGRFVPGLLVQVVALSLAATVATLPLVWVNFGRVSLAGPLANIVVEPVFAVAFWLSVVTAAAGALWAPAGWAAGLAAYYPLAFVTWFARSFAEIPFAAVDLPKADAGWALALYALAALPGWFAYRYYTPAVLRPELARSTRILTRRALAASAAGLAAVAIVPTSLVPLGGPGALQITLLDAGDGNAVLVTTPHGRHVIVDAGPSANVLAQELGAVLPHWTRSLDALFVSLPQEEQAGGAAGILGRYHTKRTFDANPPGARDGFVHYASASKYRQQLAAGDTYEVDGITFRVLWPLPGHELSSGTADALVLRVEYASRTVLLASDVSAGSQKQLAAAGLRAAVLVVPHHAANKSDVPFIEALRPALALIPVGTGRYAAQPSNEVLEVLTRIPALRTDVHGRVTVHISPAGRITYQTQR